MTLVTGIAAVIVALASLYVAWRAFQLGRHSQKRAEEVDRRELLLRVHERLATPELQRGRRLLFDIYDRRGKLTDLTQSERDEANQALAAFDIAGLYCAKGYEYMHPDELLKLWAAPLMRLKYAAEPLLAWRRELLPDVQTWPYFADLADRAEKRMRDLYTADQVDRMIMRACDREAAVSKAYREQLKAKAMRRLPGSGNTG